MAVMDQGRFQHPLHQSKDGKERQGSDNFSIIFLPYYVLFEPIDWEFVVTKSSCKCNDFPSLLSLTPVLCHTLIFYPSSLSVFLHPEEMHFKDVKAMKSDKSALWGVFSFYEDWQKNIDGNCLRGKFNFQISFLVPRQYAYFPQKT